MLSYGTLLRCLLIVAFCLEGTLSLWSSSAMATEGVVAAVSSEAAAAVLADEDCEEQAPHREGGAPHRDCDCGTGAGCCACAFPVLAVIHSVPFAAQHRLADQPAALAPVSAAPAAATGVFRPPIA